MRRLFVSLVTVVLLAACAGEPAGTTQTTAQPQTTTSQPPAETTTTSADPGTTVPQDPDHEMIIEGFAFSGPDTVSVGDSILVTNRDSLPHTWSSTDGDWSTGTLTQGMTFLHTFTEAGTFSYFCGIHPEMTGTITVEG